MNKLDEMADALNALLKNGLADDASNDDVREFSRALISFASGVYLSRLSRCDGSREIVAGFLVDLAEIILDLGDADVGPYHASH